MIIVLDNIRSAYNVGSIIRTSEALGAEEVWLCGITPGIENEKVKKTSLGAENNIKIKYFPNIHDCAKFIETSHLRVASLEITNKSQDISSIKPDSIDVLIIGNEVSGVSDESLGISQEVIMIPMKGKKESLNVSVACGIALYMLTKVEI